MSIIMREIEINKPKSTHIVPEMKKLINFYISVKIVNI